MIRRRVEALPGYPDVYVREMSGREFSEIQPLLAGDTSALMSALARVCACDADGGPYWVDGDDPLDAPVRLLKAIMEGAVRVNGLGEDVHSGE